MKLIPGEDSEAYLQRLVSECGQIEMGICVVVFGFRVAAGYTRRPIYEINYCGGDKQNDVELLYSAVKQILESMEVKPGMFNAFPLEVKRPFPEDLENFKKLLNLVPRKLELIKLPSLWELRIRQRVWE